MKRSRKAFRGRWMLAGAVALAMVAGITAPAGAQDAKPVVIASAEDVTSIDPHLITGNHPTGSVIWSSA